MRHRKFCAVRRILPVLQVSLFSLLRGPLDQVRESLSTEAASRLGRIGRQTRNGRGRERVPTETERVPGRGITHGKSSSDRVQLSAHYFSWPRCGGLKVCRQRMRRWRPTHTRPEDSVGGRPRRPALSSRSHFHLVYPTEGTLFNVQRFQAKNDAAMEKERARYSPDLAEKYEKVRLCYLSLFNATLILLQCCFIKLISFEPG